MDPKAQFFRPDGVQVSKFHFYSLGIVAANKALSSDEIEVTPTEELTMLDGDLDANQVDVSSQGEDANGSTYSTSIKTANSIRAKWLKLGVGNRLTAPDVRRGAPVIIYQFGDSDKFYWTTLQDDSNLRKLETVIYGFSGTKDEGAAASADNMYYFEISTHSQMVTFHTSKANGEFCMYDFQFNTKEGKVILTDDLGNYFMLDSQATQFHIENVDGSIFDMTKKIASLTTLDQINMKSTNQINMETDTMTVKAKTGNFNVDTRNDKGNAWTVNYDTQNFTGSTFVGQINTVTWEGALFDVESASIILA
jgi:hypothetical protein